MNLLPRRKFLALLPVLGLLFGRPSPARDPFQDPAWIARWKTAPRQPIWESPHPREQRLLAAIARGETLRIRYHGGGTPGALRVICPSLLFESEGYRGRYLAAHCQTRNAPRTFCVELIDLA